MDIPASPEIASLITAFYAAFDNRGGRAPAVAELRALLAPLATITRVNAEGADTWDPDAFIAPREAMLTDGTLTEFHEWEVAGRTEGFGHIAGHSSVYRKEGRLNGAPYEGSGRKFISLFNTGGRWLISSILWEDD